MARRMCDMKTEEQRVKLRAFYKRKRESLRQRRPDEYKRRSRKPSARTHPGRHLAQVSSRLRKEYGLSIAQYREMVTAQSSLCAICGKPETSVIHGRVINLTVDHCHATGNVRGLLCRRCNVAMGALDDSSDLLRAAAAYLDRHST